ncbi:MAG: ATP-binding cassette domain-containing protein [Spirochaetales bacterium]|nr:ATP-binding cassette domain-containing protein [Spirochaetales bacterium]
MSSLRVESLSMSYGRNSVLSGAYFKVVKGEITSVVGRNGCGKSTLIKAMVGLFPDSSESLFIDGQYISKKERMLNCAYLPQHSFLPKNIKVKKLLKIFLSGNQAEALMADSRISSLLGQKAVSLSGGELRYLEFLMIASLDRRAYLFDEPFSGIEPIYIKYIKKKLLDLKNGGRYILITDHDFHSVRHISDRIWLSRAGRFQMAGDSDQFLIDQGYLPAVRKE